MQLVDSNVNKVYKYYFNLQNYDINFFINAYNNEYNKGYFL